MTNRDDKIDYWIYTGFKRERRKTINRKKREYREIAGSVETYDFICQKAGV